MSRRKYIRLARDERTGRVLGLLISAGLHAFAALLWTHRQPLPVRFALSPIPVGLVEPSELDPPGAPDAMEAETSGRTNEKPPTEPHPAASFMPADSVVRSPRPADTVSNDSDLVSEAQLAGASGAGAEAFGERGRSCDTAGIVQQALRRDPVVRKAVEDAGRLGRAIMLWNGDWVRSGGQDGKGLSAVREVVMWEVAFAPEVCRNQRMRGLVLISLADGDTRFAIGSDEWRWSDLLGASPSGRDR